MPTSDDFSGFHKRCALLIGFIECLLFGGVIYGWADLVYVMRIEGIFHDSCLNSTHMSFSYRRDMSNASCQDDLFNDAFTAATLCRGIAALLVSFLLDYCGLRITRLVAISSILLGGFFIGYTSKEHPYYLFPGSILIALGGAEIRLADFKIANMFPSHKATVMSIYNGAFSGSGAIFLALKYASDDGVSRSTFMYIWAGISAIMLFPTFLLLPKSNIEAIDQAERIQMSADDNSSETQLLLPTSTTESDLPPASTQKYSFFHSFCTFSYWIHVYSAGTLGIGITLYISSFNPSVVKFPKEASYLTEIYGFCQLPMIAIAPLIGILMDYTIQRALKEPDEAKRRKKLQQAGFASLMCFTICITLLAVCKIFPSITSLKLSLAVYTIAYPIMNAVIPGYVRIRFHQDHFNKLMGIMGTINAAYSTLQIPLFTWMEKDPHTSNIVIAVWMASTLVNPLHLLFLKERTIQHNEDDNISTSNSETIEQ